MGDESEELKDRISQMSDGELLRIVGPDRNDYVEEAIGYAVRELKIRNIPFDEEPLNAARASDLEDDESAEESESEMPTCDVCGGELREGWLMTERELTIFFPESDEERFIRALACKDCGELRLVVDFQTDVQRHG